MCSATSRCCLVLPRFTQMSKPLSRQRLRNQNDMLRYDLTRLIISSHVGSLSKFWVCAYWIFTIVTGLASPTRPILVMGSGWGLGFRLAQFQWHIARVREVRASNYPIKRIPHGVYYGQPQVKDFLAMPRFAQISSLRSLKIAKPGKNVALWPES